MRVRAEFTTEPFHGEGEELPGHLTAVAEATRFTVYNYLKRLRSDGPVSTA